MKELYIKYPSIHCDKLIHSLKNNKAMIVNCLEAYSQNQNEILQLNINYNPTRFNFIEKIPEEISVPNEKNTDKMRRKNKMPICRICLCDENVNNNPLINPCACSGTMKYIHLFCLKHW